MPANDDYNATMGVAGNPGSSQVIGANSLQQAIDKFDSAVTKLSGLYDTAAKSAGSITPGGITSKTGGPQSSNSQGWVSQLGSRFSSLKNGFGGQQPNQSGQSTTNAWGVTTQNTGMQPAASGQGSGQGYTGLLPTMFGQIGGKPSAAAAYVTARTGGGTGGGAPSNGGSASSGPPTIGGTLATAAGAAAIASTAYGLNQYSKQVQLSGFVTQNAMWLPAGAGAGANVQNRIGQAALANKPLAMNQSDQLASQSIISGMYGTASGYGNAQSNQLQSGANAAGYAMGQGAAAGAQFAANLYSPTSSMAFYNMGLGNTAPGIRGSSATRSMPVVAQGLINRLGGTGGKNLSTNISEAGAGYGTLLALSGGDPNQAANLQTMLLATQKLDVGNKATGGKGLSTTQQTALWNASAGQGSTAGSKKQTVSSADAELAKYGINTSDQQRINNASSQQMNQTANTAQSFNDGLTASTAIIGDFNAAVTKFLNIPGVKQITGIHGGIAASLANVPGGAALMGTVGTAVGIGKDIASLFSAGGRLPGYGGGDVNPALLESGETVVSKEHSKKLAGVFKAVGVPGYSSGGAIAADAQTYVGHKYVYGGPSNPKNGWDCSSFVDYVVGHDEKMSIPGGSWASTTSKGAIHGPATGDWASWGGTKVIGTDASKSLSGDIVLWPSHVGISLGGNKMVSAYDTASGTIDTSITGGGPGGESFQIRRLTGASPGTSGSTSTAASTVSGSPGGNPGAATGSAAGGMGLSPGTYGSSAEADNVSSALAGGSGGGSAWGGGGSAAGGSSSGGSSGGSGSGTNATGATKGTMSAAAIAALWVKMGGAKSAAANMARIAMAESTDRPGIVQSGQSPGLTGYGLYQITPTSGISQGGKFGNLLNASNNTRAAISLYKASGYSPWTSDPVGASLAGHAAGTGNAPGGLTWVGERGPELTDMPAGTKVASSAASKAYAKGTAQTPWTAQLSNIALGSNVGSGGGHTVNVTFGDIQIGNASGSGAQTPIQNAREFIRETKRLMEQEDMFTSIAGGVK